MILTGDLAQLPPVGMTESLAMNPERLRQIGLNPICFSLEVPVRQAAESGILNNATIIRQFLYSGFPVENFALYVNDFPDVEAVSSADLADRLAASWSEVGQDETIIITRSNKRANNQKTTIIGAGKTLFGISLPMERWPRWHG